MISNYHQRWQLLRLANDKEYVQSLLFKRSQQDIVFWFNTFCWTFDPRKSQPHIPFELYPYQEWFVKEIEKRIENQEDWGVEKSRDMGVSWLVMLVLQHGWLFKPGWSAHVGSRREAEVDKANYDTSTLFGKFRYNLSRLPYWMRPSVTDKKLSIINLENGNLLSGESANPSFSRGHRHRCVVMDELAFWDLADAAYGAASETTKCRGVISTPYGGNNRFARLMADSKNVRHIFEA